MPYEKHGVFAHVRAIGTFINGSGLGKASSWMVWQLSCCARNNRVHTNESSSSNTWAICLSDQVSTTKRANSIRWYYATEDIKSCIEAANYALKKLSSRFTKDI